MWFWWFLFVCDLLVPVCMLVFGRMMQNHPPGKINGMIGYRTARSMKSRAAWEFAHAYCGRLWQKIGWVLLVLSAIVHIPFYNSTEDEIGVVSLVLCSLQCVILIISIFLTERQLKEKFTDDGVRR